MSTSSSAGAVTSRTRLVRGAKGRRVKRVSFGFTRQKMVEEGGQLVRKQVRRFGFATVAEAAEALARDQLGLLEDRPPTTGTSMSTMSGSAELTFGEAGQRYLAAKSRKRSIQEDERQLKHLVGEFGKDTPLSAITAARVAAYRGKRLAIQKSRRGQPLSAASINRPLQLLRHLLKLAASEWEVLAKVPTIRLEREPEGKVVWLAPEAEHALLVGCRASGCIDLDGVTMLATETGMRQSEILNLEWSRIDMSRCVIYLAPRGTKSKRRREIPMRQKVYNFFATRSGSREGYVFPFRQWSHYRSAFETVCERIATLPEGEMFTFHSCRHHFASWFMMRGGRFEVLQQILGHQTAQMTMRYAHLSPGFLSAEMARTEATVDVEAGAEAGTFQHPISTEGVESTSARA